MELSDVENLILTGCAVVTLLGAGGGALLRVCRMLREIQEQNVIQNTQLVALTRSVEQLQQWAMARRDGR